MIKTLTLLLLFCFSAITLADSAKSRKAHFFEKPYECLSTKTSKKSGKKSTNLYYYHPDKSWRMKLSKAKKDSPIKIVTFDTSEGRYAGRYTGVYPDIKKIEFDTFWPNKKSTADKPYSKLNKDDCQVMKEPSVFELPDGKSLACMDIKKTGICNTLKNN